MSTAGDRKLRKSLQMSQAVNSFAISNKKDKKVCIARNIAIDMIELKSKDEAAEKELQAKKVEFTDRMEACSSKKAQLSEKRLEFDKHVASFKPIIEDGRMRRFKALQKAKAERREVASKDKQLMKLKEEVRENREKIAEMQREIAEFQPMLTFLDQVKEQCQGGYFDENVPIFEAIRKRYTTLKQVNEDLKEKNSSMLHMLTDFQSDSVDRKAKHDSLVMELTSEMIQQKVKLDRLVQENITREEQIDKKMLEQQVKHQSLHVILNTIENISRLCKDPSLPVLKPTKRRTMLDVKLRQIQEFFVQKSLVADYALQQMSKPCKSPALTGAHLHW